MHHLTITCVQCSKINMKHIFDFEILYFYFLLDCLWSWSLDMYKLAFLVLHPKSEISYNPAHTQICPMTELFL